MSAVVPGAGARPIERLVLGAALLASAVLVWFATGELLATAVFAAGLIGLAGVAWFSTRHKPDQTLPEFALPDWSVTVAAIDRADAAIAVTDRAGRLVCANPIYERRFTAKYAPPRLAVDNASLERLAKAGRAAWRDGKGVADLVESSDGRWKASALRAGRGDDYLVWTISPLTPPWGYGGRLYTRLVRKGSAFDNPWLLRLLGLAGSLYAVIGGVNTWLRLVEVR